MLQLAVYNRASFRRILQAFAAQSDHVQMLWREDDFYLYSETMNVSFRDSFFDDYTCDDSYSISISARSCRRLARNWDVGQIMTLEALPDDDCVRFALQPLRGRELAHRGILRAVGSSRPAGPQ